MTIRNVDMAGFVASADQAARLKQATDPSQHRHNVQYVAAHVEAKQESRRTKVDENHAAYRVDPREEGEADPGGYDDHGRRGGDDDETPHVDLVA